MAFNISCSTAVFFKEKTYQILLSGKPHMLQILCSSVRVNIFTRLLYLLFGVYLILIKYIYYHNHDNSMQGLLAGK